MKETASLPTLTEIVGTPDFGIVNESFLTDDLQKGIDIHGKLDYLHGQGLFFDKLSCVTAQNQGDDHPISLNFKEHENLVGIIGFENHPSILCLDDNGSLCVGLLPEPKTDIIKNGVGKIMFENYAQLLHHIDNKTERWSMQRHFLVSNHVFDEQCGINDYGQHAILVMNVSNELDSPCFGIGYNRVEYNEPWLQEVLPVISEAATDPEFEISPNYSVCINPRQSYLLPMEYGLRFWTLTEGDTKYIVNVKDSELMTQELIKFIKRKVLGNSMKIDLHKDDGYYSGIVETSAGTYCPELHDYDGWDTVGLDEMNIEE